LGRAPASTPVINASVRVALYGTDEALPSEMTLRAGPLLMTLRGCHVVGLMLAGHEVWHGVTFLYRDPDWGTPEPVLQRITQDVEGEGFALRLEGYIPTHPIIDLLLTLQGDVQGTVRMQARAVPRGDVLANRIGLCLMVPMHAVGQALEVAHADGRLSRSVFPEHVPPWPPFTGISGLRHEFSPGHWAQVQFQGDDFEFEDQRNNADASFKIYSRSNTLPRPYLLRGGVPIEQSLTLRIGPSRLPLVHAGVEPWPLRLHADAGAVAMPKLGLAITPADAQASRSVMAALAELAPSQLHLTLSWPDQPVDWLGVAQLLSAAGARLRLDLSSAFTQALMERLALALREAGIAPESVAVFPGTPALLMAARLAFPGSAIGSGTPHFFAQFNRMEEVGATDFLSFTVCPTVHSADDSAPMLGLQSLPSLLATARVRYPGRALRLGPSSLGARISPLGNQPATDGMRRLALAARDPRTRGLFGAAWLLGHVAQAARAGAAVVSVMGLLGDAGVLDETADDRLVKHPAFFVLAQLARMKQLQTVSVTTHSQFAVLASGPHDATDGLIANLTSRALELPINCAEPARVMDVAAWQSYVAGEAESPWRSLGAGRGGAMRLEAFGVALLA